MPLFVGSILIYGLAVGGYGVDVGGIETFGTAGEAWPYGLYEE